MGSPVMTGDELVHVLATLASPHRMRVVAALIRKRSYVSQLARELGMSRALLQVHLRKLEAAGLVHTLPGRSTVVSTIERKTVFDAQAVAATMHALAVRIAVPLMGKGEIAAMVEANRDFAAAFAAGAGGMVPGPEAGLADARDGRHG